ncbi:MAG: hypothetical protein JXA71_16320 [Chitinispirillaceae bacterium]|nr:hypothetical protein [Chitinispirillaceae bacterium]
MKYVLVFLLGALLSGAGVFLFMNGRGPAASPLSANSPIERAGESVQRRFAEISQDLQERLAAFAREVEGDQLFSLRLIVENYPSAPEVVNKAVQFLNPMGLSFLDITDSAYTAISCGHFPASAGNSIAAKMEALSEVPAVVIDRVKGDAAVTFQARHTFRIAETMMFHVAGGIVINEALLERLSPYRGVRVLFKQGNAVVGMDNVRTISEVRDQVVIIDDREYKAAELPLPVADGGEPASLIVILPPERR